MLNKNFLAGLGLFVLIALGFMALPPNSQAQENGGENFIFVNYIGQDLNLDLDDVLYVVPDWSYMTLFSIRCLH